MIVTPVSITMFDWDRLTISFQQTTGTCLTDNFDKAGLPRSKFPGSMVKLLSSFESNKNFPDEGFYNKRILRMIHVAILAYPIQDLGLLLSKNKVNTLVNGETVLVSANLEDWQELLSKVYSNKNLDEFVKETINLFHHLGLEKLLN